MDLYFFKGFVGDIRFGVEAINQIDQWDAITQMSIESQEIVRVHTQGKTDLTGLYTSIIEEGFRGGLDTNDHSPTNSTYVDSGWDNYPPPPSVISVLDNMVRSRNPSPTSQLLDEVNRTLAFEDDETLPFDADDELSLLDYEEHIANTGGTSSIISCPVCRTDNSPDKCVEIKGSSDTCTVCLENSVEIFFLGCSHAVTCKSCFDRL
tara:strand:+ start:2195 stop:2815 length:621 start_codon:yes stop_codon:yes gene_type:complete